MRDYTAWVDACQWIAENTPATATFLTPRLSQSFKWRTGRAEVVTRKDVPQDAATVVEWFQRLRDVHYRPAEGELQPVHSLSQLGTFEIERLARRYKFDYVLTSGERRLGLPVAYENSEYVVYAIHH
jgi:hypothetical protein